MGGGQRPWLLQHCGNRFQLLHYVEDASALDAATTQALSALAQGTIPVEPLIIAQRGTAPAGLPTLIDSNQRIRERYDLQPGTSYLLRPDQHVAARWRQFDANKVRAALARATGNA